MRIARSRGNSIDPLVCLQLLMTPVYLPGVPWSDANLDPVCGHQATSPSPPHRPGTAIPRDADALHRYRTTTCLVPSFFLTAFSWCRTIMQWQIIPLYVYMFLAQTSVVGVRVVAAGRGISNPKHPTWAQLRAFGRNDPNLHFLGYSLVQLLLLGMGVGSYLCHATDEERGVLLMVYSGVDQTYAVRGATQDLYSRLMVSLVYCTLCGHLCISATATPGSGHHLLRLVRCDASHLDIRLHRRP